MSELVECPACRGSGSGGLWLDPDYGPPKCERCHGVGEVDPVTLVPFAWAGIPPILGWQMPRRNTAIDCQEFTKQIAASLDALGITVTLTHPMLKKIDIPE